MNSKQFEKKIKMFYNQEHYGKHRQYKICKKRPVSFSYYGQFLNLLGIESGRRILDIACGTGGLLLGAKKRGMLCYGIDISQTAISEARKRLKGNLVCKPVEDGLPYSDRFFDYVTCLGSLEHFQNQPFVIQETSRVSKDECRMCILVPNNNYILHKFGYETDSQPVVNRHSLKDWKSLLESNGLVVSTVLKENSHLENLYESSSYLKHFCKLLANPFVRFLPLNLSYNFVFLCKKDVGANI